MATVFLAHDLRHKRPVALKVLHPELAQTLGPERFQREIETAARLQHPHILTVHDSGEAAGQLWFTMPFVEGESLRDRLRREQQLPVEDALRIATEAARALQYAHDHGVIHRDIKPENLLLTKDGSTLVADFGIARALSAGDERLTETGMSVGTPAYMSPEQAAGDRHLDARTDVYSLGTVLYEMLAGEPPFTGATAQAVIAKRFSGEAASDAPACARAFRRAWSRRCAGRSRPVPADRFASAAEFARALQRRSHRQWLECPLCLPPPLSGARKAAADSRSRRPRLAWGFSSASACCSPGGGASRRRESPGGAKVLAVLPFENLGDSARCLLRRRGDRRGARQAVADPGLAGHRPEPARTSTGDTKKSPAADRPRAGGGLPADRHGAVGKAAGGASRVRVSPELVEVRPGHAPAALGTAIRRGADRRVPGAGRHRGPGGAGAERGAR